MERFATLTEQNKVIGGVRAASLQGLKPKDNEPFTWRLKPPPPKENAEMASSVTVAFRVMRPAQAVRVELRDELPVRVYLRGMRGEVVAASGPWRSSGDWWQEDVWHQDEWDLEIEFPVPSVVVAQHAAPAPRQHKGEQSHPKKQSGTQHRLYRIYYDALRQGWFVRGSYD